METWKAIFTWFEHEGSYLGIGLRGPEVHWGAKWCYSRGFGAFFQVGFFNPSQSFGGFRVTLANLAQGGTLSLLGGFPPIFTLKEGGLYPLLGLWRKTAFIWEQVCVLPHNFGVLAPFGGLPNIKGRWGFAKRLYIRGPGG